MQEFGRRKMGDECEQYLGELKKFMKQETSRVEKEND